MPLVTCHLVRILFVSARVWGLSLYVFPLQGISV